MLKFNHVWDFYACDLWSKNPKENSVFGHRKEGGVTGDVRGFWPEANPFASWENLGGETEWVMFSCDTATSIEMPLSEAFNPPPAPVAVARLVTLGSYQVSLGNCSNERWGLSLLFERSNTYHVGTQILGTRMKILFCTQSFVGIILEYPFRKKLNSLILKMVLGSFFLNLLAKHLLAGRVCVCV